MKDHSLLVERYRPDTLEGYVGNENIKASIKKYISQNDIQNPFSVQLILSFGQIL